MVPKGWQQRKLGEIATLVTSGSRGWASYYADSGDRFIRITNLQAGSIGIDYSDLKYVRLPDGTSEGQRTKLTSGDILISITADLGLVGLIDEEPGTPTYINQHIALVRLNHRLVDRRFVAYCLSLHRENGAFARVNDAGAKAGLNLNTIRSISLRLPRLQEQQKIARTILSWDRALEIIDGLIVNASACKCALIKILFDPDKGEKLFGSSFRQLRISDIADVNKRSLGQDTPPDYPFRYISLSDIEGGDVVKQLPLIRFDESPSRARRCIDVGDILMSTVRPNLQAFARVTTEHTDCIASTGFAVLSANPGISPDYIYHYLFSPLVTNQLNALVVGSNYPAINSSDVENLVIYCPPLPVQVRIAQTLNAADATHRSLKAQRECLILQKRALMQQLLTGKRRVRVDADAPREVMSA